MNGHTVGGLRIRVSDKQTDKYLLGQKLTVAWSVRTATINTDASAIASFLLTVFLILKMPIGGTVTWQEVNPILIEVNGNGRSTALPSGSLHLYAVHQQGRNATLKR